MEGDEGHLQQDAAALDAYGLLGLSAKRQDVFQPDLDSGGDSANVSERNLSREAGRNVVRQANVGSKRSGRTLFDPGADDHETGVIPRHVPTMRGVASRDRYGR
jgi:hypothetical protein